MSHQTVSALPKGKQRHRVAWRTDGGWMVECGMFSFRFASGALTGKEVTLQLGQTLVFGKSDQANVKLADPSVADFHFEVELDEELAVLRDLGSPVGTHVNGQVVRERQLKSGDIVRAGNVEWIVCSRGHDEQATIRGPVVQETNVPVPVVPGYADLERLGCGAFGCVYRARRLSDNQPVAIKILHGRFENSPQHLALFVREIKCLRRVTHPNVAAFLDAGRLDDSVAWFAMELINGPSLSKYMQNRTLPIEECLELTCQLLDGVGEVHRAAGVTGFMVHRDIKPSNILLDCSGSQHVLKLVDLGLAKVIESGDWGNLTATGTARGTMSFMSPEQLTDSKRADTKCDIFSVGAVMYFMLTGSLMYDLPANASLKQWHEAVLKRQIVPLSIRRSDVPGWLDTVFCRSVELSGEPFSNAKQFSDLIRQRQ